MKRLITSFFANARLQLAGAALALLLVVPQAPAADSFPPGRVNFQGFVKDVSGYIPGLTGPTNVTVTLRIYRTAGGTSAGDIVWAEQQTVTFDRGYYSVLLGNGTPNGSDFFTNNLTGVFIASDVSERYLGLTVQGYGEIKPRLQFMASPFAQLSRAANTLVDDAGRPFMVVTAGGLGIGLTNAATATVDVGGNVKATNFVGSGAGLTNVTAFATNISGTIAGSLIANGALTSAKLAPGSIDGSKLADGSVGPTVLAPDAVTAILSQAGGVGSGGIVLSMNPTNTALSGLGYVNLGSSVVGGDRWVIKATEVTPNAARQRNFTVGSSDSVLRRSTWTGTKWIIFGGRDATESSSIANGAIFDPALNSWTPMSTSGEPSPRDEHQTIWVGDRMWLYGGYSTSAGGVQGDAFFYNPTSDQWTTASTVGSPGNRDRFSAVYTGTEIIVWGGVNNSGVGQNTGARYNPTTDTWRPMAPNPQPGRGDYCMQWTGTEMIVAGGYVGGNDRAGSSYAARYNPVLDNWTPLPNMPLTITSAYSVWTGSEFIIGWGWNGGNQYIRYSPTNNFWSQIYTPNAVLNSGKVYGQAVWTGAEMIVVGGYDGGNANATAARFNPKTGVWAEIRNVPKTTVHMPFTWTGTELLIFGDWQNDSDQTVISYTPPIQAYLYAKP